MQIYDVLNIQGLEERGESFYNPLLGGVIEDLEKQELAVESEGAKVVYLEGVSHCIWFLFGFVTYCARFNVCESN